MFHLLTQPYWAAFIYIILTAAYEIMSVMAQCFAFADKQWVRAAYDQTNTTVVIHNHLIYP